LLSPRGHYYVNVGSREAPTLGWLHHERICRPATIGRMTASQAHVAEPERPRPTASPSAQGHISVLLYSDDVTTRDAVRAAVGRRPARDVEVSSWRECATAPAVIESVEQGTFDVLVLDGEAAPVGGLGLCRQLKSEIFNCPPVLVLTGRPQDSWLAAWSLADLAVPHPLDPLAVAEALATLGRATRAPV
jgi:CheY-like chemotaxis protein